MTDNKNLNKTINVSDPVSPVSMDDEKLLESFFADCRMDIPDDGFSDRVMAALPAVKFEKATVTESEKLPAVSRRLEHVWTATCVIMGLVFLFVFQGMSYLKDCLFAFKVSFLTNGSRILSQTVDAFAQSTNLWMMLGGVIVLMLVWGYNEVMDAR